MLFVLNLIVYSVYTMTKVINIHTLQDCCSQKGNKKFNWNCYLSFPVEPFNFTTKNRNIISNDVPLCISLVGGVKSSYQCWYFHFTKIISFPSRFYYIDSSASLVFKINLCITNYYKLYSLKSLKPHYLYPNFAKSLYF